MNNRKEQKDMIFLFPMRKLFLITCFFLVDASAFCQNNDNTRLIFENNHVAANAQIIDVMNAVFLSKTGKLTRGAYYIIHPCVNGHIQNGDFVTIYSPDMENYFNAKADTLYRWLKPKMPIIALLKYTGDIWRPFDVIEIIAK